MTPDERKRYARHISLKDVGEEGQAKLKASSVLIVGAGGLGSPAAMYLAAAGVGTIGIVDGDKVDLTNLQRQILHKTKSVGVEKTESAIETLADINPHVSVHAYTGHLSSTNALEVLKDYDIILDCSDNFATRYLVNDACILLGKPLVYASISEFAGQVSVFNLDRGPCYRCLCPQPPKPGRIENCEEGGVLGVLPGILGTIQATEALKILLGLGRTLSGRLLTYDALSMKFSDYAINKNNKCAGCGENPITQLQDYVAFCGGKTMSDVDMTVEEVKKELDANTGAILIDVREQDEWDLGHVEAATLHPLSKLKEGDLGPFGEAQKDAHIMIICRSGGRSMRALEYLQEQGYTNLKNVAGGMRAWSAEIDPSIEVN